MEQHVALALAGTIRHDGNGGVADDLDDVTGLATWLRENATPLRPYTGDLDVPGVADERTRREVVALRRAVRSLFAQAVRPGPPSRADSASLLSPQEAVDRINETAAAVPVSPVLTWAPDAAPTLGWRGGATDARLRLVAGLARAAAEFVTGPARERLRACPAPRCVRYFVQEHPRQAWCKPSCGNRARVARHYQRQTADR
ncbi:CGNR zinc finger domain-containing protein [Micromonospora avicenniae]|uniref:CGNR zinc finger domain-containing protein n=1 Tax=Micromonospora avicenniae TaxID=1198245 RepID=A0A1N7FDT1_9ACTN|nr:ABATE domain-containing protein [Micromonospora avicenniae]SIR98395.1 CGNR zinc finger domain-containing protein [Micromonospora avicenniae]